MSEPKGERLGDSGDMGPRTTGDAQGALLVADPNRRYVDANPAAEALLGYARDELLQLSVEDVVMGAGEPTLEELDRWSGVVTVRRSDGTEMAVEAEAIAVAGPDGPLFVSRLHEVPDVEPSPA
jgi:PAS domain S-box-containing protein